ncbi:MAG: hypothetical protein COA96_14860 [SAR86 cluster bacterium]|uniref:Uncharacterized protein n=1 Tax=SAR86 cluster bacterium TaxID=2030880 RepID=A0A2A5AS99_9GAMM|nr:MAG: hypothetical protein COA96_14860 [SAR86 cluster bacterium]
MLRLRIRCYVDAVKKILRQYQHGLVIGFLVALPGGAQAQTALGIAQWVGTPVLTVSNSLSPFLHTLIAALFIQILFLGWIHIQKKAVLGVPFSDFAQSLPIADSQRDNLNAYMVIVANNLVWMFFIFALPQLFLIGGSVTELAYTVVIFAVFLMATVKAQLLWLANKAVAVVFIALTCLAMSTVKLIESPVVSIALFSAFCAFIHTVTSRKNQQRLLHWLFKLLAKKNQVRATVFRSRPLFYGIVHAKLYGHLLLKEKLIATTLSGTLCLLFMWLVGAILSSDRYFHNSFMYLVIPLIFFIGTMNPLLSFISKEREKFMPFLRSLPLKKTYWFWFDSLFFYSLILIISLPLIVFMLLNNHLSWWQLSYSILAVFPLALIHFLIHQNTSKQTMVASIASCTAWGVLMFIILT